MNNIKLLLLFLATFGWAACGNDDDEIAPCSPAAWAGTYTGTIDCNGSQETITITITASGDAAINLSYETPTKSVSIANPIPLNGCSFDFAVVDLGTDGNVTGQLDGDEFIYTETFSGQGFNSNCSATTTRN